MPTTRSVTRKPVKIDFLLRDSERLSLAFGLLTKVGAREIAMRRTPDFGWRVVATLRPGGERDREALRGMLGGRVIWIEDEPASEGDGEKPSVRETFLRQCASILADADLPAGKPDFIFSTRVRLLLVALRRYAVRRPLDDTLLDELVEVAMNVRRLFIVKAGDGRSLLRQHPAPPAVQPVKH